MKLALSLTAIVLPINLFAQTVMRTIELANAKAEYYVLKSDTSIKQGPYKEYGKRSNILFCEGFYKNDKRDSLWTYYAYSNVCEKGYYKDDKRIGVWEAFDVSGGTELQYDYTNRKLLYLALLANGDDTVRLNANHPPVYLNGTSSIYRIFAIGIKYPTAAKFANIQGRVLIGFTIDSLGNISNISVKKGIGHGCDEEALRVAKLIDGDWLPAKHNGKPITADFNVPVTFVIRKE